MSDNKNHDNNVFYNVTNKYHSLTFIVKFMVITYMIYITHDMIHIFVVFKFLPESPCIPQLFSLETNRVLRSYTRAPPAMVSIPRELRGYLKTPSDEYKTLASSDMVYEAEQHWRLMNGKLLEAGFQFPLIIRCHQTSIT